MTFFPHIELLKLAWKSEDSRTYWDKVYSNYPDTSPAKLPGDKQFLPSPDATS